MNNEKRRALRRVISRRFINGLKNSGSTLNRKVLADIAVQDPAGFTKLVEQAKANL